MPVLKKCQAMVEEKIGGTWKYLVLGVDGRAVAEARKV
jgi:hypothetical protein